VVVDNDDNDDDEDDEDSDGVGVFLLLSTVCRCVSAISHAQFHLATSLPIFSGVLCAVWIYVGSVLPLPTLVLSMDGVSNSVRTERLRMVGEGAAFFGGVGCLGTFAQDCGASVFLFLQI
jgi:hypothetical protein